MVISCVAVGCTSRFNKGSGLKFHRIPTEDDRRRKWLQAINRKNWTPKHRGDRVCGLHFASGSASSDPKDPDFIPHINMGYTPSSMSTPEAKKERYNRVLKRDDDKTKHAEEIKERNEAACILVEISLNSSNCGDASHADEDNNPRAKSDIHDSCLQTIVKQRIENKQLVEEAGVQQEELRSVKQKLENVRFGSSFLEGVNKDGKTLFFTGFPSYATFLWFVQYCTSVLPLSMTLTPASVFMLIMMKLRSNCVDQDLAYRFSVSRQTVNDLVCQALPSIANKLAFLIHWPEKEEIIRNLPKVIKQTYRKCRVIIDCCEIFIERPGNFTARAMTWSNYTNQNTVKVLIAVSPVGAVTFVSRAFGGRVSDKVITQRSGFLQLLEHGDLVLADRGFLISDELAARGAQLAIPEFTGGKSQLSPKEIETVRRLSRVRIHVERATERVKKFKILSTSMEIKLVPQFDNIMTICSAVSNLHPQLVT